MAGTFKILRNSTPVLIRLARYFLCVKGVIMLEPSVEEKIIVYVIGLLICVLSWMLFIMIIGVLNDGR